MDSHSRERMVTGYGRFRRSDVRAQSIDLPGRQYVRKRWHGSATAADRRGDVLIGACALPLRRREVDRTRSVGDHRQAPPAVAAVTLRARLREKGRGFDRSRFSAWSRAGTCRGAGARGQCECEDHARGTSAEQRLQGCLNQVSEHYRGFRGVAPV